MLSNENISYAIIGWGNGGTAFAAHLTLKGCKVNVYNHDKLVSNCNRVVLDGNIENKGIANINKVTNNIGEAIEGAKIIICCMPTNFLKGAAQSLAPFLAEGQMILLAPGGTGGVLEVRKALLDSGCKFAKDIFVAEAEDLPFACRRSISKVENDVVTEFSVHIFKEKNETLCAGLPVEKSAEFFELINKTMPGLKQCKQGILRTSLNNTNICFHPIPTFMMIDRLMNNEDFDYYIDGFTPEICEMAEKADNERLSIAKKLEIEAMPSVLEWLKDTYSVEGTNFYQAIHNNNSYRGIKAPKLNNSAEERDNLRYINEDMRTGLLPYIALGEKLGVPTPVMSHFADEIKKMCKPGYFDNNVRTLESMGLAQLSVQEIKSIGKSV